jgi:hypothetical protein
MGFNVSREYGHNLRLKFGYTNKLRYLCSSCCAVRISEQQLQCVHVKHQIKALTYGLLQPDRLKRTQCGAETRSRESLAAGGATNFY